MLENNVVYAIISEWDIGEQGAVYLSEGRAQEEARKLWELQDQEESFEEVWGEFIFLKALDLIE